jgi:adenylate cyclase
MDFMVEFINEKIFSVAEDQTLLEASLAAGIQHFHVCGGRAKCSTCRVVVQEGAEFLNEQTKAELKLKKKKNFDANVRLACQTKVISGDIKAQRIIKDETDMNIYVYADDASVMQNIGEEKELALFFLDIRDFTPFIEKHLPFDVIHIIRRLMKLFTNVINANNGKLIEFAGDGLYAAFGFDEEINAAVNNAVKAGRNIFEELNKLNSSYIKKYFDEEVKIGIGIHNGRVIIGEKGIDGASLTVMGFAVNIAARLETATKELNNSFVISENVYSYLNEVGASQKQILLKGVSVPFDVRLMGENYY